MTEGGLPEIRPSQPNQVKQLSPQFIGWYRQQLTDANQAVELARMQPSLQEEQEHAEHRLNSLRTAQRMYVEGDETTGAKTPRFLEEIIRRDIFTAQQSGDIDQVNELTEILKGMYVDDTQTPASF